MQIQFMPIPILNTYSIWSSWRTWIVVTGFSLWALGIAFFVAPAYAGLARVTHVGQIGGLPVEVVINSYTAGGYIGIHTGKTVNGKWVSSEFKDGPTFATLTDSSGLDLVIMKPSGMTDQIYHSRQGSAVSWNLTDRKSGRNIGNWSVTFLGYNHIGQRVYDEDLHMVGLQHYKSRTVLSGHEMIIQNGTMNNIPFHFNRLP